MINYELNHSCAHLLAAAVLKMYPNTKIGYGPVGKEGFHYDFLFDEPISDKDLKKIERQMKKLQGGAHPITGWEVSYSEAKEMFKEQPFKLEKIEELHLRNLPITVYKLENFIDLCQGRHVDNTKELKHFELLSLGGSYWKGDSKNQVLTRIYGTCWESQEKFLRFKQILKERSERDHRKIGKEMKIFMTHPLAGQGFPIWLKNGMIIKNELMSLVKEIDLKYGFEEVSTPIVGATDLYKTSGHWSHYKDDMFPPMELDNEELVLRPMTCPHHCLIYKSEPKSYKDLPLMISEQAPLFRYEKSGALIGLERVRSMLLTEGHIFARMDQIDNVVNSMYNQIKEIHSYFKTEFEYVSLSLRDPNKPEKYFDNDEMWEKSENQLKTILDKLKIPYKSIKGEAAFYGPKIDFQATTALGHEITISTIQLDFLLPEKFELEYRDAEKQIHRPVMIHRGLIGTYERFIAMLLEQSKGALPFWIRPEQIRVIPVNNEMHGEYAKKVHNLLVSKGARSKFDDRNERMGKKIREAQTQKVYYQIIIGDEEVQSDEISIREYGKQETIKFNTEKFADIIYNKIKNRN